VITDWSVPKDDKSPMIDATWLSVSDAAYDGAGASREAMIPNERAHRARVFFIFSL
jgi:hypothetical protein